ncbi:hypothetical protein ACIREO_27640 [Streptomyces sp. NPDC102441]|uniref:hypothetical protein n=1 Tax=Streptomyces sp. NPDC102441 TaxID=3366176 RepID=UPI00381F7E3C
MASLLTRRRGVVADPERLVVCSGVAQATTLLGFVLRERGTTAVGAEDPGSPEYASLFASAGLTTVPLPLGDEGLAVEPLLRSGVRAVVTTPAHQFPAGIAYSARRRGELLDWARASGSRRHRARCPAAGRGGPSGPAARPWRSRRRDGPTGCSSAVGVPAAARD